MKELLTMKTRADINDTKPKRKTTGITITSCLLQKAQDKAKANNLKLSHVLEALLWDFVNNNYEIKMEIVDLPCETYKIKRDKKND